MSQFRSALAIARVEVLRLRRSRLTFTLLLLVPALQVLLFGYAVRPAADAVAVVVAAPDLPAGQRVIDALAMQPGVRSDHTILPPGAAAARVHAGDALIGIEVPILRSIAHPLAEIRPFRVVVDAANAGLTATAVARIETAYWRTLAERSADPAPGLAIERLYNPQARSDWTFLPSLIGVTVMISMIMLGSLSLARERETGTWESLLAMPVRPVAVLAGKLLPYALIGTLQGALVLAAGVVLFDLPMRGSVAALLALLPLFAAAHLAVGYAIAARAPTQLAALQGAVAFYLPAMLLSGFLYPFAALPGWARTIGNVFPLTHFIQAAQGALLRGDTATTTLAYATPIAAFLVVMIAAALLAHARRLD
jgi:ABC-2 type transport system permease protein